MNQNQKSRLLGTNIGLLVVYLVLGMLFYFAGHYDLLSIIKILALMTIFLLVIAIPIIGIVWLVFFLSNKNKR